jgi:hypothetical protein
MEKSKDSAYSAKEYLDASGVEEVFSIRRGVLAELAKAGAVESVKLGPSGPGKRLYKVESIREYLRGRSE